MEDRHELLAELDEENAVLERLRWLFFPLAQLVVNTHRWQLKHCWRRDPLFAVLYGGVLFLLLLHIGFEVISSLGSTVGAIALLAIALIPALMLLKVYSVLEYVYDERMARDCVFPGYDSNGDPFNESGVQLSVLLEFVNSCGGRAKLQGMTTTEVCDTFLKPMTALSRRSYCDFLLSQNPNETRIGKANVFISHAWKYQFLNVVDAILLQLDSNPLSGDVIIWFDLFSNNQHGLDVNPPPFGWWCHTFLNAIKNIGRTVIVLEPWEDPIPLTRAWCLWELFCTVHTRSKLEIAMSSVERDRFNDCISRDPSLFYGMLSRVNTERSEAFMAVDKERIFDVVKTLVGFDKLNKIVISCLRKWYISLLEASVNQNPAASANANAFLRLSSLGQLYQDEGSFELAERSFVEYLSQCCSRLGDLHAKSIEAVHYLATLYAVRGNIALAVQKYEFCRQLCQQGLHNDPNVADEYLRVLLSLARGYAALERYQEALETLDSLKTAASGNVNYTDADNSKRIVEELLLLKILKKESDVVIDVKFRDAISSMISALGKDHPHTLEMQRKFGVFLSQRWGESSADSFDNWRDVIDGREEAEVILRDCVSMFKIKLGSEHAHTLRAVFSLAEFYSMAHHSFANSYHDVKSYELYGECLIGRKKILGKFHPDTVEVLIRRSAYSDYVVMGLTFSLLGFAMTMVILYSHVCILNGFAYGIDRFSSAIISVFLGFSFTPALFFSTPLLSDPEYSAKILKGMVKPFNIVRQLLVLSWCVSAVPMLSSLMCITRVIRRKNEYIIILYFVLSVYGSIAAGIAFALPLVKVFENFLQPVVRQREHILRETKALSFGLHGKNVGNPIIRGTAVSQSFQNNSGNTSAANFIV